jgi:hypothetical protein
MIEDNRFSFQDQTNDFQRRVSFDAQMTRIVSDCVIFSLLRCYLFRISE